MLIRTIRTIQIMAWIAWIAVWLYLCITISPSGKRFKNMAIRKKRTQWIVLYTFVVTSPIVTCLAFCIPSVFENHRLRSIGIGSVILLANVGMVITMMVFSAAVLSKTERHIVIVYAVLNIVWIITVAYSFIAVDVSSSSQIKQVSS